ncbi:hypothetical protein PC116_g26743 [Phytophthora cactorum]|nr:hypothetical protein PC116_g26743 [Phytophthora cactorum]
MICSRLTLLNEMLPSTVMFLVMGNRALSIFSRADLPEPGWPSNSVILPGENTPLTSLRISLRTTRFLGLMNVFFNVLGIVGSSYLELSSSTTTTSAVTDRLLKCTSICGMAEPRALVILEAMWSCKTWGPSAIKAVPDSYPSRLRVAGETGIVVSIVLVVPWSA